jgi:hypothetical protein
VGDIGEMYEEQMIVDISIRNNLRKRASQYSPANYLLEKGFTEEEV